jgi:acetyltransferase
MFDIRHYPTEWISCWPLGRSDHLTLRPILPQDALPLARMLQTLSPRARQCRFHGGINTASALLLKGLTQVDFDQHMAFVVTHREANADAIVAEARYVRDAADPEAAEFALLVDDRWQRHGIGTRLLGTLMQAARAQHLRWLHGEVLSDNRPMLTLMQGCRFVCTPSREDDELVCTEKCMDTPAPAKARLSWPWPLLRTAA